MKQFALKSILFISVLGLTSCSTNTQGENTGIGAATGAVVGGLAGSLFGQGAGKAVAVGVGAIAGALVGGYIGHNMDSTDHAKCAHVLNNNPPNHPSHWKNDKTGMAYEMTPTSKMMSYQGNPNCREYTTTSTSNDGKTQTTNNIACRQANGNWQVMSNS